ncbi:MAG: NAD(P)/FAD-dependent oxidoreductase [Candidatus Vogelbacteria bacterium]|nr:NAD(P)/FAD-dependent oxidoreductase [Candidatus Vogelbacteria bacterium]
MKERNKYDYVIIGTGSAALTFGALMANAGKRVCMLEAHDIPGGYAQSFKWGEFYFCGQVHYIWGCGPGGKITRFLEKVGLEKDITFELHDPDGYDHMSMPDGKVVGIPYGWERLAKNIEAAYPGQGETIRKLTAILAKIRNEVRHLMDTQDNVRWWQYLTQGWKYRTLIRYRNKTVQDVFDECGLSREAQNVLFANAGDMMEPPERVSIFAYTGLFGGYNNGAYYPTKHFKYYIERLADFITSHKGCRIYYKSEVVEIIENGKRITGVKTKDGKVITGTNYICNMDPQRASRMIGLDKFPKRFLKKLSYKYSPSGIMIYLGLKNAPLKEHGFGKWNIWHCTDWDMNAMWRRMGKGDFSRPWVFVSTPTLHTDVRGTVAPLDCDIMEIAAYTEYQWLEDLKQKDYKLYEAKKNELAERMIDIIAERFFPNLRTYIVTKVVGTASSNEYWAWAPKGNAYGATFTPDQVGPKRLKAKTPWPNFFWCNATSGYAGIHGTVGTGMDLYMDLTGDRFYREPEAPTDDERVAEAYARGKREQSSS